MSTQEDFRNLDSEQLRNLVFSMGVNIAKLGEQINDLATEINMLRDNLKGISSKTTWRTSWQ